MTADIKHHKLLQQHLNGVNVYYASGTFDLSIPYMTKNFKVVRYSVTSWLNYDDSTVK